ncbi:hypothetical protein SEUCBS139899_003209 [Sporothrix eucalyptigena]|uniref:F-box domain-containing protein n=1 Tax=Sporothrix eucalyptigena TaxID=1812306 RepID=A0ABP0BST2_9PEZI
MSGDAAPGAVSSSSTPLSSSDPVASTAPETVKTVPPPVVEEVPPPAEAEQPQETAETSAPEPQPTEAPSVSKAPESSVPPNYEALPQPQAPPVAPPTYESEEIIISATDAPAIITTTSSPPTMTSALASSVLSAQAPAAPTAQTTASTATTATTAPAQATAPTIAPPTTPLALHPIRSGGPGGPPPGSNPKHPKLPAKAVPSEKPVEAPVSGDGASAKKPLTLLELPVDILRLIVKEITHTNDLTSLALANSTLYNLAIPHIYSRFDIVWPDPTAPPTEGKSVDALTYGLSTLCLGSAFARTAHRLRNNLRHRGFSGRKNGGSSGSNSLREHTKFGSPNYAKYTRKFSLGNGPSDWVAEYMINKEAGKMLGTLVALCVAKMQNLENFVWDMPTGVVSDVFMALASLPDFDPENDKCKLDRIWIRWHNNSETQSPPASPSSSPGLPPAAPQLFVPQGSNLTPIGIMLPPHSGHPAPRPAIPYSSSQVEFPTFSVVPPLRSLTVLDIDEIAYLDELAVLIERSCSRLNELRIGIASHAIRKDFVQTWDGNNLQQVDLEASWPGESTIGDRRLGGVLGILVGRTYDIRKKTTPKTQPATGGAVTATSSSATQAENQVNGTTVNGDDDEATPVAPTSSHNILTADAQLDTNGSADAAQEPASTLAADEVELATTNGTHEEVDDDEDSESQNRLDKKLKLTTLELERVPLSMQVLVRAIDWTSVTTLTILGCPQHESLWRQLKKHFKPTPVTSHNFGFASATSTSAATSSSLQLNYHMALKSIHTDVTSKALLSFIRETLAPNTLEVLFLQNRRQTDASPLVSIQDIFKSAIKPHRASLTKLLIDGHLRTETEQHQHLEGTHRRRRIWTLTTEILTYLTSGRMTNLREIAFSLHYRDWHTFLQRLPSLTELRSLHIQHIADHVVENLSMYDLAMQVADIVTLRPEVQLCFVGICDKCYEVIESRGNDTASGDLDGFGDASGAGAAGAHASVDGSINGGTDTTSSTSDEEDDDDEDDEEVDSDDEAAGNDIPVNGIPANHDSDDADSDSGDSDDDSLLLDGEPPVSRPPRLRMREIFFYDDKVAIFKARHGRL